MVVQNLAEAIPPIIHTLEPKKIVQQEPKTPVTKKPFGNQVTRQNHA
jgi:hypothetical protein